MFRPCYVYIPSIFRLYSHHGEDDKEVDDEDEDEEVDDEDDDEDGDEESHHGEESIGNPLSREWRDDRSSQVSPEEFHLHLLHDGDHHLHDGDHHLRIKTP